MIYGFMLIFSLLEQADSDTCETFIACWLPHLVHVGNKRTLLNSTAARPPALKPSNGLIDDLGSRWLGSSAGFSGYKCIMGNKLIQH